MPGRKHFEDKASFCDDIPMLKCAIEVLVLLRLNRGRVNPLENSDRISTVTLTTTDKYNPNTGIRLPYPIDRGKTKNHQNSRKLLDDANFFTCD